MNASHPLRAAWCASLLVVPAALFVLVRVDEGRIEAAMQRNDGLVAAAQRDRELVRQASAVDRERAALQASLRTVALDLPPTRLVALFVQDSAAAAAAHHTAVASIAAAPVPSPAPPFESVALDITIEGRYADILRTLRALTRTRTLSTVELTAIARKDASRDARLVATLHVVLDRLAPARTGHDGAGPA